MFTQGQAVIIYAAGISRSRFEVVHAFLQGTLDHGDGLLPMVAQAERESFLA